MSRFWKYLVLALLLVGLVIPTVFVVTGCGSDNTTTTTVEKTATVDNSTALAERANEVLAADKGDYPGNSIKGTDLATILADSAKADTVFVLDVRAAKDYEAGHIKGAENVPFAEWAAPDNLDTLPKDKIIVVVCYTGHTAAEVVGGLRMLGYDAIALRGGMMGWTQGGNNQKVADSLLAAANPTVNTAAEPSQKSSPSGPLNQPSDALYETIAGVANTDMSSMPTSGDFAFNVITAANLAPKLADPAQKEELFLLDIRLAEDYEKVGHIEGATNIPFADVAVPENLDRLPKDKKIIVICYTGNTAAQATMILRILGYDASVLKFGSMGWTVTPNTQGYVDYITSSNQPVVQ
ncbi:putative adenylyltransferase/sulfurtransferase MoeZ [bacterium BMS3Abin01]|nr:putative adenylyltransferase/sulfurtransferase MoeZ [bacterium BMS3Abin01]